MTFPSLRFMQPQKTTPTTHAEPGTIIASEVLKHIKAEVGRQVFIEENK